MTCSTLVILPPLPHTNQSILERQQRLEPLQRLLVLPLLIGVGRGTISGQPRLVLGPAQLQPLQRLPQLAAKQGGNTTSSLRRRLAPRLLDGAVQGVLELPVCLPDERALGDVQADGGEGALEHGSHPGRPVLRGQPADGQLAVLEPEVDAGVLSDGAVTQGQQSLAVLVRLRRLLLVPDPAQPQL